MTFLTNDITRNTILLRTLVIQIENNQTVSIIETSQDIVRTSNKTRIIIVCHEC